MSLLRRIVDAAAGTEPEHIVFLGLGSNIGDRLATLQDAVDRLGADERIVVHAVSSVYETEPIGGPEQDPFLNIAARIATVHNPAKLLAACQAIEQALGRVRTVRWGPRTIDIDLLLYADRRTLESARLHVPHPRLTERAFALIPLLEVAPGQALPDGRSLSSVIAQLAPIDGIDTVGAQVRVPA